jgi:hypothetical protein
MALLTAAVVVALQACAAASAVLSPRMQRAASGNSAQRGVLSYYKHAGADMLLLSKG